MPAKGGELHAHVHPRQGDAANLLLFLSDDAQEGSGRPIGVVEVEEVCLVLEISVQPVVDLPCGETASVVGGGQVRSVFNRHLVVLVWVACRIH
jgi:hypothetical protein